MGWRDQGLAVVGDVDSYQSLTEWHTKINYYAVLMARELIELHGASVETALRDYKNTFAWFLPVSLVEETERKFHSYYPNPRGSYEGSTQEQVALI